MGGSPALLDRWMMPGKSRHRFATCTARLSASGQTGHYAQFKSWARLQSRRLLLCRGNRSFSRYVARQPERPQPRGLFTRGQTVCLVFGRCFLTVQQPLLLLLENRLGSITCLMSVDIQRRYSFSGESHPAGQSFLGTGHRLPICRCGLSRLINAVPAYLFRAAPPSSFFRPGHATCPHIARYHSKRPFMGDGSLRRLSCQRGSQNRSAARTVWPAAMKCA